MRDRTGDQVGRLLVIGPYAKRRINGISRIFWTCQCECGVIVEVCGMSLTSANTRSCGCLKRDTITTHNMTHTREYRTWCSMMRRCYSTGDDRYEGWGGRGITVCERWHTFENFFADMGCRPTPDHSIDRIDNDGNYEPSNCRWATQSEQQRNKRKPNMEKLPRGDDHWTRKDPERARRIGAANIRKSHGRLEANGNAKLTMEIANQIRATHEAEPNLTLVQLGARFGIGRETARKVIRRLSW